jgi:hypothetical protein
LSTSKPESRDTLPPINLAIFIFDDASIVITCDLVTVLTETSAALIIIDLPEISVIIY